MVKSAFGFSSNWLFDYRNTNLPSMPSVDSNIVGRAAGGSVAILPKGGRSKTLSPLQIAAYTPHAAW